MEKGYKKKGQGEIEEDHALIRKKVFYWGKSRYIKKNFWPCIIDKGEEDNGKSMRKISLQIFI